MDEKPPIRIPWPLLSILLCLAIFLGMRALNNRTRENSRQLYAHASELSQTLVSLRSEKAEIENSIARLETEYREAESGSGILNMLITEPSTRALEELVPVLEAQGIVGSVAVSEHRFPGDPDCMSPDELLGLVEKGWTLVMTVEDGTDIRALYQRITDMGLPQPEGAYFPDGTISVSARTLLDKLNVPGVMLHSYVIPGEKFTTPDFLTHGIGEWTGGSGFSLKEALGRSWAVFITVGYEQSCDQCTDAGLATAFELFRSYRSSELGRIAGPREAAESMALTVKEHQANKQAFDEQHEALLQQLDDVEARIREAYETYEQE